MPQQQKEDIKKVVKEQEQHPENFSKLLETTEETLSAAAQKVEQGYKGPTLFKTAKATLQKTAAMMKETAEKVFEFRTEINPELANQKKAAKENNQEIRPQFSFGGIQSSAVENSQEVSPSRGSQG